MPVEVKSGKDYQKHSALKNVMNENNYNIRHAIVFSSHNVTEESGIAYLPLYMAMCLEKNNSEFVDISVERFTWSV